MKTPNENDWAAGSFAADKASPSALMEKADGHGNDEPVQFLAQYDSPQCWHVRIVCDEPRSGEFAAWLLQRTLFAAGLDVQCSVQTVNVGKADVSAILQAAMMEAANADLVIASLRGAGGIEPDALKLLQLCGRLPGTRTAPVAVILMPSLEPAPGRSDLLLRLQELCDDTNACFYNSLSSAVWEVSNAIQNAPEKDRQNADNPISIRSRGVADQSLLQCPDPKTHQADLAGRRRHTHSVRKSQRHAVSRRASRLRRHVRFGG